jgi:hypothetical protein
MIGLHQPFHKSYLVETGLQEEAREGSERFLTQVPSSIKIIAAREIASGKDHDRLDGDRSSGCDWFEH